MEISSLSVSERPSLEGPKDPVHAMITSSTGCDLRPPVDNYALECEAKQCSLEVALKAPRSVACAFNQVGWGGVSLCHIFPPNYTLSSRVVRLKPAAGS